MGQFPATGITREEATKRGGPSSALRLVGPGEDPRILSTNPDHFFGKLWPSVNALVSVVLVMVSVLAVRFLTIELWNDDLPWVWNATWLIVPWVVLAPLWGMWSWWRRRRARVSHGREVIAAMVRGTPAERGRAIWVSYDEDPVSWRGLDVLVVAEFSGGEAAFVDARSKTRPCIRDALFQVGDPIWLWRGSDGWVFGQVAPHGLDPTYSPADEPQPPTWEDMHGGHSPEYFRAGLSDLAAQYRAGRLTRKEHDAAVNRLLDIE